jgi:hypothetical protein
VKGHDGSIGEGTRRLHWKALRDIGNATTPQIETGRDVTVAAQTAVVVEVVEMMMVTEKHIVKRSEAARRQDQRLDQ